MIVIPMAGLSSRFFKEGYEQPKYMLLAHGLSLFEHSVKSFEKYFKSEEFIFIVRDNYETPNFVRKKSEILGIKNFKIIVLHENTKGQAETVFLGLKEINKTEEPITIFNIDTFRPGFIYPELEALGDGYLEVFQGEGDNWSFVRAISNETTLIDLTTEKKPISKLCCTGLYYFKSSKDYIDAYNNYIRLPIEEWEKGELYVAPLYNYLIRKNKKIHYNLISREDVIFCGVPSEYKDFLSIND